MPFRFHHQGFAWGGGGIIAFIIFLIILAAICCVVFTMIRQGGHAHPHQHHAGSPPAAQTDALKILNERFARGEIDAEDYTQRRDLLKGPT